MLIARVADYTDFYFIHGCILYGARKGHYSVNVSSEAMLDSLKQEIHSLIKHQCLLDERHATVWVFEQGNKRVAMLILCDPVAENMAYEIYALSVTRKFQAQGYGSQVLDLLLEQLPHAQLYARCSASSSNMQHMLEKRGFKVNNTISGFNILVRHSVHMSDFYSPIYSSL